MKVNKKDTKYHTKNFRSNFTFDLCWFSGGFSSNFGSQELHPEELKTINEDAYIKIRQGAVAVTLNVSEQDFHKYVSYDEGSGTYNLDKYINCASSAKFRDVEVSSYILKQSIDYRKERVLSALKEL